VTGFRFTAVIVHDFPRRALEAQEQKRVSAATAPGATSPMEKIRRSAKLSTGCPD